MARFSFSESLFFRWSSATAKQLNDVFDKIRDYTVSNFSTDSVKYRAVDDINIKEPLYFLLSDYEHDINTITPASPMVEVTYPASGGTHKIVAYGFTWYRRADGSGVSGAHGNNDNNEIRWYDNLGASWNTDHHGTLVGGLDEHEDTAFGHDKTMPNPWSGPWGAFNLIFNEGGGQCIKSCFYKTSEDPDWPPAGESPTKFGIFGQMSTTTTHGKATIWLFAEDDNK